MDNELISLVLHTYLTPSAQEDTGHLENVQPLDELTLSIGFHGKIEDIAYSIIIVSSFKDTFINFIL